MMNSKNLNGLNRISKVIIMVLFVTSVFILNSCVSNEIADSADVNQDKIYISYSVYFDAERDHDYSVTAQFRFGGSRGTTLILTNPSNIVLNGEKMNMKTSGRRGCWYESTLSLDSNKAEFIFTDTEGKKLKNKYSLNSIDMQRTLSIDMDARRNKIAWTGKKLGRGESANIQITDEDGNIAYIDGGVKGSKDIIIKKKDLEGLVPGKAEIFISRTYSDNLKERTSEGGSFRFEYRSPVYPIVLVSKNISTNEEDED